MTFDPLSHTLKLAQLQIHSANLQLDDCLEMPETDDLDPKDAWLIRHTRNRLRDCNYTLNILIPRIHETQHSHPDPTDFITAPGLPDQMPLKSQSPHNGQPDRSK